jgi:hypothetical protein
MIEPIIAVPLNDELQGARALVARAELEALSKLTDKVKRLINLVSLFAVFLSLHLFSICRFFSSLIIFRF